MLPTGAKSREAGKGVRGRAQIGCSIAILTANRRPLSFLFLTLGHTFGVRVHRVHRRKVDGPPGRRLWSPDATGCAEGL